MSCLGNDGNQRRGTGPFRVSGRVPGSGIKAETGQKVRVGPTKGLDWGTGGISFCMWLSSFPNTTGDYPFLIEYSWLLGKYYLTVCMGVYFWILNSVPLVYVSIFMSVPYCFDDYSIVI